MTIYLNRRPLSIRSSLYTKRGKTIDFTMIYKCLFVEPASRKSISISKILGAVWLRWPAQMARGTKGHLVAANRPCMKWPLLQPNGTSPSSGEAPCTCISQLHFSIVLAPESSVRPRHPSRPSFQPLGTPQNHHPP